MRLWSVHPRYLDAAGLTACWREGLLARKVLLGETKGYKSHPQLIRFRSTSGPIIYIDTFLTGILDEARRRGYHFDETKILPETPPEKLPVTEGQLCYEFEHLKSKLHKRHPRQYQTLLQVEQIEPHPLFYIIPGPVETWERPGQP